jgi:hypothetical protein
MKMHSKYIELNTISYQGYCIKPNMKQRKVYLEIASRIKVENENTYQMKVLSRTMLVDH